MGAAAWLALLRGVNVGGRNALPMATLRALCADLGWQDVATFIQSGNVVFRAGPRSGASADADGLADDLERALAARCDRAVPVVVRAGAHWLDLAAGNPFREASASAPGKVLLAVARPPIAADAAAAVAARATAGEEVAVVGGALWIHYRGGVARSQLTPALLDRVAGAPVTARNWRTVGKLAALVRTLADSPR